MYLPFVPQGGASPRRRRGKVKIRKSPGSEIRELHFDNLGRQVTSEICRKISLPDFH